MIEIKLKLNYGYKWYEENYIYVKGYAFIDKDILLEKETLVDYFKNIKSNEDFENRVKSLSGCYSIIVNDSDKVYATVDRTRTFPLFYSKFNGEFYLSDDTFYLKDKINANKINEDSVNDFLATGYVTGNETILENVFQIQSSEYITYQADCLSTKMYFKYIPKLLNDASYEDLSDQFLNILEKMAKRMIKYANGKQIVLPLSGGYDSRLIATLLRKYKYDNVLCYTYGSTDSYEVSISKQVAKKLNFRWIFVEYTETIIPSDFTKDKLFLKFSEFAFNYSSKMSMQDYFAVKYLYENKIVDKDSIFIPGHSGDFLGGSHFSKLPQDTIDVVDLIIKKHYVLNKVNFNKNKIINLIKSEKTEFIYALEENWNMKERQSKHIVNSLRNYEFFGYKHMIPLWDLELVNFFKNLPVKYKINSKFYQDILFNKIFLPYNIDIQQPIPKDNLLKKIIRPFIPDFVREYRSKRLFDNKNKHSLIVQSFLNELDMDLHAKDSNAIIALWDIKKIRKI